MKELKDFRALEPDARKCGQKVLDALENMSREERESFLGVFAYCAAYILPEEQVDYIINVACKRHTPEVMHLLDLMRGL